MPRAVFLLAASMRTTGMLMSPMATLRTKFSGVEVGEVVLDDCVDRDHGLRVVLRHEEEGGVHGFR